jgi:hypothetical protein
MAQATGGKGTDMAQHAIQRPMRARLAIGTGLLAAGMLLVAPAATAFTAPTSSGATGGCKVAFNLGPGCNKSDTATTTGDSATTTGTPMSHHPCGKHTPPDSNDDDTS